MAKHQSLGRGFDALIPKDLDTSMLEEDKHRVQQILIQDIAPNPDQPRRQFDQAALAELTASVKRHGVLQPIIVVRAGNGYRVVAGERRWRAAKAAQLPKIPAIVRSLEELEQIELSLIENIQRVDLSPLEQAISVYRLQQQFNLGLEQIAQKLGKATSTVSNLVRLLNLPADARQALVDNKITEGHARAILSLAKLPDKQAELFRCILDNGWTVRQAEQFATAAKRGADSVKARANTASQTALTKDLSRKLGSDVRIKHTAKGGQLIIHFDSEEQLSALGRQLLE